MLRTLLAVILALAVSAAGAQIVNRPVAAGAISNPGTSLPSTCAVGYLYFKSDSTAGQNLHLCASANTWTQMTGGNLANPVTVLQGGTGRATSTTAYGLLAAGTTATGNQQTLAAGATTEILVGGGAAALPVWTTATGSGAPVRATSPQLVTPGIGSATIGTRSNTSGTDRISVNPGPTIVFSNATSGSSVGTSSAIVLCNGYDTTATTKVWTDVVLFLGGVAPVKLVASVSKNAPATTTYAASGGQSFTVTVSAGNYNVSCTSLETAN